MSSTQEMSLDQWVDRLPVTHRARKELAALRNLAEAVLLFYGSAPWQDEQKRRWRELSGTDECASENLLDMARRTVEKR